MKGVRPADFPPPFSDAEAIGPPTDAPDERIDVGILIVGGGPGGLACAVRLGSLRTFTRLATVVITSTTTITASETGVPISGTDLLRSVCAQCSTSFAPMKARMIASPVER